MDRAVFDRMAAHDQLHWWYVARRRILHDLITREIALPPRPRILVETKQRPIYVVRHSLGLEKEPG